MVVEFAVSLEHRCYHRWTSTDVLFFSNGSVMRSEHIRRKQQIMVDASIGSTREELREGEVIAFEELHESFRVLEDTESAASGQRECCTDRREIAAKLMLYLSGTKQKSRVSVEPNAALEQRRDDEIIEGNIHRHHRMRGRTRERGRTQENQSASCYSGLATS